MSPSRGYGHTQGGGGYRYGYSYANSYGNAYSGSANIYGNAYSDYAYSEGNASGNGYTEYEQYRYQQQQYRPQVEPYQPESYQVEQYQPEQFQVEQYQPDQYQYQQQYPQQHSPNYNTYPMFDTFNAQNQPQRRPSPSYDDYDGSSAARRPFSQSSRGYSTYSSQPSSSSRRPAPPRRPHPPSEPLLMPTSSTFNELIASRAASRSPHRRSASPQPPPPPRRTEPREEYIRVSQEPSSHVDPPEKARKLIVLDLNGSLLLRSAHQRRPPPPRHAPHSQNHSTDPYADPTAFRPLRIVYPRPYLSSFVAYILHPKTKQWLDTMVWSSAQPHSVNDMVDKCFKERRQELRAVWARDTLGLTNDEYYKKSLTLKDLEKPWEELPIISSSEPSHVESTFPPATSSAPSSSPASDAAPIPTSASESTPTAATSYTNHSARTTLLIDDSPLKAGLQPWNHLVIREYVQEMRNRDLRVADLARQKEKIRDRVSREMGEQAESEDKEIAVDNGEEGLNTHIEGAAEFEPHSDEVAAAAEIGVPSVTSDSRRDPSNDSVAASSKSPDTSTAQSSRVLKRLQKKEAGKLKRTEEHAKRISATVGEQKYDQTLLAVIGILDRVKWEDNIAGWMKAGGLINVEGAEVKQITGATVGEDVRAPELQPTNETGTEKAEETTKRPLTLTHTPPTRSRDATASPSPDDASISGSGSKKRRRVSDETENVGGTANTNEEAPMTTGMDTSADVAQTNVDEVGLLMDVSSDKMRSSTQGQAQAFETITQHGEPEILENEKAEQAATGIPSISEPSATVVSPPQNAIAHDTHAPAQTESPKLWYEYPEILAFWAERGQKALGELGIEVTSGIVVNGGGSDRGKS